MSATADMGRAVEKRADPQVRSEISATFRLAGPPGIGDARRLVEADGKPYLLLNREVRPVDARKPFRRPPVAAGVAPKFLGIESRVHDNDHGTGNDGPTAAPVPAFAGRRSGPDCGTFRRSDASGNQPKHIENRPYLTVLTVR